MPRFFLVWQINCKLSCCLSFILQLIFNNTGGALLMMEKANILIVDDELGPRESLRMI